MDPLPDLPPTPRYPCPFITASDVELYLSHLYAAGWGISSVQSGEKTTPSTTQLSRTVQFPNPDIADIFMKDANNTIIKRENHHPTWEAKDGDGSSEHSVVVHVHTHSALDNTQAFSPSKRPGITLRDIRFALLFEELLRDYKREGLINIQSSAFYSQPMDIDSVHNIRP